MTADNRAYSWGYDDYGQLGDGTSTGPETCQVYCAWSTRPVAVLGGLRFRSLSSGNLHTCGVTTADRAHCWGSNNTGQLGDSTTTSRLTPVEVFGRRQFRQVSAGRAHTCGVTPENVAYCRGYNRSGEVGDSTEHRVRKRPVRVAGGHAFRQVAAGGFHTCAVTTTDRTFCWGSGRLGQLGNGKTYLSFWPRRVAGGLSIRRVTAGPYHSCGVTTLNRAYCWGSNYFGELGDSTQTHRLTPVAVAGGRSFAQVSAGHYYTCGRTPPAAAYCWGYNRLQQVWRAR